MNFNQIWHTISESLLVHVSREFWWTDSIALNGSTKVSESVWNENHPRITEVTWAIREKEVKILHILLFIWLHLYSFSD